MPSIKTLLAVALAGSAPLVGAAPTLEKKERNDLTPKVILDNVRSVAVKYDSIYGSLPTRL